MINLSIHSTGFRIESQKVNHLLDFELLRNSIHFERVDYSMHIKCIPCISFFFRFRNLFRIEFFDSKILSLNIKIIKFSICIKF